MVLFIIGIILLLIAVGWIFGTIRYNKAGWREEKAPVAGFLIPLFLGLLAIFWTTTTVVEARSVGVQTAYGSYVATLDNGFHVITPWSDVEKFTTTIQTVDIAGDQNVPVTFSAISDPVAGEAAKDAKAVEVAGGGKGYFDGNYAWSVPTTGDGVRALWEKYRKFDTISNQLVAPAVRDAIVAVGSQYSASAAPVKQPEISTKIKIKLAETLAPYGIVVDRVSITSIQLDQNTQASLDKIVNAANDVRTALQNKARAEIDNQTTRAREQAGSLTPAANQRYCLDILNNWNEGKNGPIPQTFNCDFSGVKTPVIIGQAQAATK